MLSTQAQAPAVGALKEIGQRGVSSRQQRYAHQDEGQMRSRCLECYFKSLAENI